MKNYSTLLIAIIFILIVGSSSYSQNIDWMGITWGPYASATLSVNGSGFLEVNPVSNDYGAAHYNTPGTFRAAATPWVEVSFMDNLTGRLQLWMEDENYYAPNGGAWTQFGAWDTYANYMIYWWDYDTEFTNPLVSWGWNDTGVPRTKGVHSVKLAMRSNGVVDYILDGALVHSSTDITPNYFGDIYLAARYETGIFTNYQTGTDYVPIPEPGTILLLGSGFLGLGLVGYFRRKRA